jgi:hypothetical protein
MKPIIQLRTIIPSLFTALAVLCLVAAPKAFGVSPPPDGGYPGGNTAEGQKALFSRTTGGFNTAVGWFSLDSLTTGSYNTGVGAGTLVLNSGDENTATGVGALLSNTTGMANTATGAFALFSNTIGSSNSAFGAGALFSNTTGDFNTAIGDEALFSNTSGSANIAIGLLAGNQLTTGDHNIDIDNYGVAGESGIIRIGATGVHTTTYIAGIAGQTVGAGGSFCYVDNEGKLGVFLSARRFKTDIADMAAASEGLLALRPVTFHYKPELDKTGIPQFGLVAEEVAKVNPDLVTHDAKGELSTVCYEAVNAMLLNEFLKEHRKVEEQDCRIREQETTIAALKKQMETVVAHAKEQDSQIQKVSAQIEMNKPAPQVVVTNH